MGDKRSNISLLAQFFCVCFVFGFAATYSSRAYIYKMVLPTNQIGNTHGTMNDERKKKVCDSSECQWYKWFVFVCLFVCDDVLFYEKRCGTL